MDLLPEKPETKMLLKKDITEIEISLDEPRLILIRGFNKRHRKWEERHLKITEKNKMVLI